jgi:hypothetical protein
VNTEELSFFAPDLRNALEQLQATLPHNEDCFTITITKNGVDAVCVEYTTGKNVDVTKIRQSRTSLVSLYDLSW